MEYLLQEYKLAVLGARGAGKSSFAYRFICQHFLEDYDSYHYDKYGFRRQITLINDEAPLIDILDALAGEKNNDLQLQTLIGSKHMFRIPEGFLILYSVDSETSFAVITQFVQYIHETKDSKDVPIAIIGTKTDLPNRAVSFTQGEELAKKYNALFYEVNLQTGANVEEAVIQLCLKIREHKLNRDSMIGKTNSKVRERCSIC